MTHEQKEPVTQAQGWQSSEAVESWQRETRQRQMIMQESTQKMLDAADLRPGDRVLDIAAGTGDQSLLAARRVGPDGMVLATDISEAMLKVAANTAQQEGLSNVITRVMDAEHLDLESQSFDAVICRQGLMLIPHLQQALSEILRVLKSGRKLAAQVWSTPERNPLFSLPLTIIAKHTGASPLSTPTLFSLGDPAIFEQTLKQAGFHDVNIQAAPLHFQVASVEAFLQARRGMVGAMERLSEGEQQQLLEEVKQALLPFEGPQGLVAPGEVLIGVGTK
jgi:ubiquinone/menaquinone biosynthesis C-methylase UbiE